MEVKSYLDFLTIALRSTIRSAEHKSNVTICE